MEIRNPIKEMKNAFGGPLNNPDTAKEKIANLEPITIETSKTEKANRKNPGGIKNRISKICETIQKVLI
jgi:hypothetical protein